MTTEPMTTLRALHWFHVSEDRDDWCRVSGVATNVPGFDPETELVLVCTRDSGHEPPHFDDGDKVVFEEEPS